MRRCKHHRVTDLTYFAGVFGQACLCGHHGQPDARVCAACGEWLSLGAAHDAPKGVRDEILAAKIALGDAALIGLEADGYASWFTDSDPPASDNSLWHAARLAAAIVSHGGGAP